MTTTLSPERQQPTAINVSAGTANPLSLTYFYCLGNFASCTSNNGNIKGAGITARDTNWTLTLSQTFTYDGLNRLKTFAETGGGDPRGQTYDYDQWGNRVVVGGYVVDPNTTPQSLSEFNNRNQWVRGAGDGYDDNGNQTSVGSKNSPSIAASMFSFDAENRMTSANVSNFGAAQYLYDGEGHRVRKVASGTTIYVYDASGQLAAEYSTETPVTSGIRYVITDMLGSTRLLLDATGTPKERIDYLPFGEELRVGVDGRPTPYTPGVYPSTPDQASLKFTGKERDAESGLDYFGARYFSAAQGRFTSPDPKTLSANRIQDPQQWNMYAYTRNNPLLYVDPDGKELRLFVWNRTGAVTNQQAASIGAGIAQKYSDAGVMNVSYSVVSRGRFCGMTNDGHSQVVELVSGKDGALLQIPARGVGKSDPQNVPNYGVVDVAGQVRGQAPKTEADMINNAVEVGSHELAHSEMGHSSGVGTDPRIASSDPTDIMDWAVGSNVAFSERESKILQTTLSPNHFQYSE